MAVMASATPRRQMLVSLVFALCIWCISIYPTNHHHPHIPTISLIEPTWERERRTSPSPTATYPFWKFLGHNETDERTIVLRIHYHRRLQQESAEPVIVEEQEEQLAVNIAFEDIYKTILFIAAAWALGQLSVATGMPALVGEIVTGFLLGPPLANFVPFPEAMVLIGNFGLIGLILESGIDIDVAQLKETGKRAVVMAFVGTTLPLLVGLGLGKAAKQEWKEAIAIGAAFAPSSLGVSANVLQAGDVLNTPTGQMIVASSVVDDVLGLILLSILEVFVKPNPTAFDFILPFLSSFGYLIVLGYSGITWMPYVIESKIMPRFPQKYKELVAFSVMFFLLIVYLPVLNYSGASYLTGAFLAGLPFSQIHSIHGAFARNGRQLLNWLLRIFFAATIGFQVPITKFTDGYVLRWGVKFLAPILAKLPLGFFIPRFQRELPDDFPYNPYHRDVLTTSLAVLCRGEFNFIIASYSLGVGLIGPDLYSAIVLAVLMACVLGPLLLARCIKYYNDKSKAYLEGSHPIHRIGNTCDGYRPLFLAIQARTSVESGLQETFQRALEEAGLIIIDHRSWHTMGHDAVDIAHCLGHEFGSDAVDITELFVQDTKVRVKVSACFALETTLRSMPADVEISKEATTTSETSGESTPDLRLEDGVDEEQEIQDRCDEIKEILSACLKTDDPSKYRIQVSQWKAFTFDDKNAPRRRNSSCFTFHEPPVSASRKTTDQGELTQASFDDSSSVADSVLIDCDLWVTDQPAHDATREGCIMSPDAGGYGGYNVTEGCRVDDRERRNGQHRRAATVDPSMLSNLDSDELETFMIRERLHGYVRSSSRVHDDGQHH